MKICHKIKLSRFVVEREGGKWVIRANQSFNSIDNVMAKSDDFAPIAALALDLLTSEDELAELREWIAGVEKDQTKQKEQGK